MNCLQLKKYSFRTAWFQDKVILHALCKFKFEFEFENLHYVLAKAQLGQDETHDFLSDLSFHHGPQFHGI
jgi:hypothetical protein